MFQLLCRTFRSSGPNLSPPCSKLILRAFSFTDFHSKIKIEKRITQSYCATLVEAIVVLPDYAFSDFLCELVPFMPREALRALGRIFRPCDAASFKCRCEMAHAPNADEAVNRILLPMISDVLPMDNDDVWDLVPLLEVVIVNLWILETEKLPPVLNGFYKKFHTLGIQGIQAAIEDWEPLLRSLFEEFTNPPDFVVRWADDSTELEVSDERLCIAPRFVVDGIQKALASISDEFGADGLMAVLFDMSAIVTFPVIDNTSAGQALQLIASVSEFLPHVAAIAACSLYIASHCMRAHKISMRLAVSNGTFAFTSLRNHRIAIVCLDYLFAASDALPACVAYALEPELVLGLPSAFLLPDEWVTLSEATARTCLMSGRQPEIVAAAERRLSALSGVDGGELIVLCCQLTGIARSDAECSRAMVAEFLSRQLQS